MLPPPGTPGEEEPIDWKALFRPRNIIIWIIIIGGLIYWYNKPSYEQYLIRGKTMGTSYMVKYWASTDFNPRKITSNINVRLNEINKEVSTWNKESDIVKFNKSQNTKWVKVKPFFAKMVLLSGDLCAKTGGMFDISISPLIDMWGFDAKGKIIKNPSQAQLNTVNGLYGCDKIKLNVSKSTIAKTNPNVKINLSAIAKGGAVDNIGKLLESKGVNNYLIEIGGEVRVSGEKLDGSNWVVGIEQPSPNINRAIQLTVPIKNESMATSGDYRNYFERSGVRYSHIIDPRTKKPITHNLASVSVVAKSTALADGLATGLLVMGEKGALKFANKQNLAIYMIVRDKGEFKSVVSKEWIKKFGKK